MPALRIGGRRFLLAPADLVVPLVCGSLVNLFFLCGLIGVAAQTPTEIVCRSADHRIHFKVFLTLTGLTHLSILLCNVLSGVIAVRISVVHISLLLHRLLYVRFLLNLMELACGLWGTVLIFALQWRCLSTEGTRHSPTLDLLITVVICGWSVTILGWCLGLCLSKPETKESVNMSLFGSVQKGLNPEIPPQLAMVGSLSSMDQLNSPVVTSRLEIAKERSVMTSLRQRNSGVRNSLKSQNANNQGTMSTDGSINPNTMSPFGSPITSPVTSPVGFPATAVPSSMIKNQRRPSSPRRRSSFISPFAKIDEVDALAQVENPEEEEQRSAYAWLRWLCCVCAWEERSVNAGEVTDTFYDMASLFTMLTSTRIPVSRLKSFNYGAMDLNVGLLANDIVSIDISPSEVITGLYLLHWAQKHYTTRRIPALYPMGGATFVFESRYTEEFDATLEKYERIAGVFGGDSRPNSGRASGRGNALSLSEIAEAAVRAESSNLSLPTASAHGAVLSPRFAHAPKASHRRSLTVISANTIAVAQHKACVAELIERHGMQPRLSDTEISRIEIGQYFVKYAVAAYGLPLYTLENPCCAGCRSGILPFGMCCRRPSKLKKEQIEGEACCGMSSVHIFLHRSGLSSNGEDLLYVSQTSGLHKSTFFISRDREKKCVVVSIRGTLSIPDSVTDANCKPTQVWPEVDRECYGHAGMVESARTMFETLNGLKVFQDFLESHLDYELVLTGHSLGAAVSILVSIFMKFDTVNPNYSNHTRKINCYAYAPPICISSVFARKLNSGTIEKISTQNPNRNNGDDDSSLINQNNPMNEHRGTQLVHATALIDRAEIEEIERQRREDGDDDDDEDEDDHSHTPSTSGIEDSSDGSSSVSNSSGSVRTLDDIEISTVISDVGELEQIQSIVSEYFFEKSHTIDAREFITCFIWDKDLVPRLQWLSLMKMRASLLRLLSNCERSPWWVYQKGLDSDSDTISEAMTRDCPYIVRPPKEIDEIALQSLAEMSHTDPIFAGGIWNGGTPKKHRSPRKRRSFKDGFKSGLTKFKSSDDSSLDNLKRPRTGSSPIPMNELPPTNPTMLDSAVGTFRQSAGGIALPSVMEEMITDRIDEDREDTFAENDGSMEEEDSFEWDPASATPANSNHVSPPPSPEKKGLSAPKKGKPRLSIIINDIAEEDEGEEDFGESPKREKVVMFADEAENSGDGGGGSATLTSVTRGASDPTLLKLDPSERENSLSAVSAQLAYEAREFETNLNNVFGQFRRDVMNDVRSMSRSNVNAFGPSLWNTRFEHVGMLFHIVKSKTQRIQKKRHPFCSFLGDQMSHCLKCKTCCTVDESKDGFKYLIYPASPRGFQDVFVCPRMTADHMPHVYIQCMKGLDLKELRRQSNTKEEDELTIKTSDLPT